MIYIDSIWLATGTMDRRAGTETGLAGDHRVPCGAVALCLFVCQPPFQPRPCNCPMSLSSLLGCSGKIVGMTSLPNLNQSATSDDRGNHNVDSRSDCGA